MKILVTFSAMCIGNGQYKVIISLRTAKCMLKMCTREPKNVYSFRAEFIRWKNKNKFMVNGYQVV